MIIINSYKNELNAGLKAPEDIIKIMYNEKRDKKINLYNDKSKMKKIMNILKLLSLCFCKDVILVQYPSTFRFNVYKNYLSKRKIILLHDVEGIRKKEISTLKREIKGFDNFEYIICHNESMKKFLVKQGISPQKIKCLELFDYIVKEDKFVKNETDIRTIVYAGNLCKQKSPFLYQIKPKDINFKFNLYGVGIEENINEKMTYKGKYNPDELPLKIEGNIGLVWDGNYDESDENEGFKNYTKYNNPHKLSCYIAAGLPVIVWRKAAIADFVNKYNIGYTIETIYDINNINFNDYDEKLKNVRELSEKVKNGYFTRRVFDKIFEEMGVRKNEI